MIDWCYTGGKHEVSAYRIIMPWFETCNYPSDNISIFQKHFSLNSSNYPITNEGIFPYVREQFQVT